MKTQVYSIREAAANNVKRLAEEFGPQWAMDHIIPQVCWRLIWHIITFVDSWRWIAVMRIGFCGWKCIKIEPEPIMFKILNFVIEIPPSGTMRWALIWCCMFSNTRFLLMFLWFHKLSISWQVLEMINDPHYLYRMTILSAISLVAPVLGSEITCSKLLPVIVTAAKDRLVIQFWISDLVTCMVSFCKPDCLFYQGTKYQV